MNYLGTDESILLLNLLICEHEVARIWYANQIEPRFNDPTDKLELKEVKDSIPLQGLENPQVSGTRRVEVPDQRNRQGFL
jgi:hypothetical protein